MGKVITQASQVEILATPAAVRNVFINFSGYDKWQQGWKIEPTDISKSLSTLKPGDGLKVSMNGMVFHPPVVKENSPDCFAWEGSFYGLLTGRHHFFPLPSKENPGATTFVQREDYRGLLATLYYPWSKKEMPSENWDTFNAALKKEVERVAKA